MEWLTKIQADYIVVLSHKIISLPIFKIMTGIILGALAFLFDTMLQEALLALMILIVFDFITALGAVYKTKDISIESAKVYRTALKATIYYILISSAHLAEIGIGINAFPLNFFDETIIGFLAVTEFISILENTSKMGYSIPKKLLNKLNEYHDDL